MPSFLKNASNMAPQGAISQIRVDSLILVESADRTSWNAVTLDMDNPAWSKVQLPPGTTAQPIDGPDKEKPSATTSPTVIEVVQGNMLNVFSLKHGEWLAGVAGYVLQPRAKRDPGQPLAK
jgi:hypothetical protein